MTTQALAMKGVVSASEKTIPINRGAGAFLENFLRGNGYGL